MKNVAQEKMNEIVDKLIFKLENDQTGNWTKSWIKTGTGGLPSNFSSKTGYNGFNIISLWMAMEENKWSSNQFMTFSQIKKRKGVSLKKGSVSTPVFFFKMLDKEEEINGVIKEKKIPLLKFFYVFNIDDVEGLEISTEKPENIELNEFVSNCRVEIKTRSEAYYSPSLDYIGMPALKLFNSTESYASTLLHEVSHATGHHSRLDRDMKDEFGSDGYALEECIAELSSMFLMSFLNIQGETKNSEAYIHGWLIKALKADPKLLWKIASSSSKVFNFLLEKQEIQEKVA